jgi:hypothetical protein
MEQSKEQLVEQIADNPERFGMARLHLFNQLIDLRPKERELREKLETAKDDKQKAFFQKALTNVQGWIEEFAAAYELLGEKPAAIVEAMGVQQDKMCMSKLRSLLTSYDKEEISISKFLEEINNHFINNWQPASKDADYDGTYLAYIEKLEECKAINHYQRTVFNRMNKWILEEGETLLYWMELPAAPAKAVEAMPDESGELLRETQTLKDAYADKILRQNTQIDDLKMEVDVLQKEIRRLHEQQLDVNWEVDADEAGLGKETQEHIINMADACIKSVEDDKKYLQNLEAENIELRKRLEAASQKGMKWVNVSKGLPDDWQSKHMRYASDHYKLDTDLFEVRDNAFCKIGGTGRLEFSEVEWLAASSSNEDYVASNSKGLSARARNWNLRQRLGVLIASYESLGEHPESENVSKLTDEIMDLVASNSNTDDTSVVSHSCTDGNSIEQ